MDLSKLRRLSGDQKEQADATAQGAAGPRPQTQPPIRPDYAPAGIERAGAGPEIWLSLVVGLILMMVGREFARWALVTLTGGAFDSGVKWVSGPNTGQMVPYWQISRHEALSDSAIFLFGLAMVLEGLAMTAALLLPRYWQAMYFLSLLVSIIMTVYNLIAVVVLLADDTIPIVSMLAVGFGGYMVMTQWIALRRAADVQR